MDIRNAVRHSLDHFGYLTRVETQSPLVALTFDDGPDPVSTPALLDVLAQYGARATFFLDGPAAQRLPALVQRIENEGHGIGIHGWAHASAAQDPTMRGLRAQLSDIRRGARAVGVESHLYRPPYGHESLWTRPAAWFLRYRLVYWSVSPKDWDISSPEALADRIRAGFRPGEVVLLHDRLRHATDVAAFDRGYLVDAIERVLSKADEQIRFVTVPELLASGRPVVRHRRRIPPPLAPMYEQTA